MPSGPHSHLSCFSIWGWKAWDEDTWYSGDFPVLSDHLFSLQKGWPELAACCPVWWCNLLKGGEIFKGEALCCWGENDQGTEIPSGKGKAEVPAQGGTRLPRGDFTQFWPLSRGKTTWSRTTSYPCRPLPWIQAYISSHHPGRETWRPLGPFICSSQYDHIAQVSFLSFLFTIASLISMVGTPA